MRAEVETIHARMAQGGDWRSFRDEVTGLHEGATSEAERVILLQAMTNLITVGPHAFDAEKWAEIASLAEADYRLMLLKETMEGPDFNPVLADKITAREVAAGRMRDSDEFRQFAHTSAGVIGDSAIIRAPRKRPGTWFFFGTLAAVAIIIFFSRAAWWSLVVAAIGLAFGTWLNFREEARTREEVREKRAAK